MVNALDKKNLSNSTTPAENPAEERERAFGVVVYVLEEVFGFVVEVCVVSKARRESI